MDMAPQQVRLPVLDEQAELRATGIPTHLAVVVEYSFVSLILAVSAPIVAPACLLVRLTSAAPFFTPSSGWGEGGSNSPSIRFRTMYQDSEPNGPTWSIPGDKRVTPIGRFLRWAHIDELPQLINILQGDMGLVGPRPERPEIAAKLERVLPDHRRRLNVRPGLTGPAQVLQGPMRTWRRCDENSKSTFTMSSTAVSGWICEFSWPPRLISSAFLPG